MGNTIKINSVNYEFESGETILEVARRNGVYIPTLCNLKGAKPTGACRICIVEVAKMNAPVASCSTPAAPGMEISTDTDRIRVARKTIIELLMISGNHNCAAIGNTKTELTDFMIEVNDYDSSGELCTAYGECELQSLAYRYMVNDRTLERIPTNYPLENNDLLIGRDFSRCILCGRCVQACTEISVNNAISHGYRGNISKIIVRGDKTLPDSECVYCGECLQVCPVGALYEKRSKYDQRFWQLKHEKAVCFYCGIGCKLDVSVKENRIIKVDGLEEADPNLGQLCFKGRFAFDFLYNEKRLMTPMIKSDGKLVKTTWNEAYEKIKESIKNISEKYGKDAIGCIVSPKYSNEDLFLLKRFITEISGSDNIGHAESYSKFELCYSQIRKFDKVIIIGTDITRDNPVAANFIKRANLYGTGIILIDNNECELSKYADDKYKKLPDFKPDDETRYLAIHSPGYDVSSIENRKNISISSLSRENNVIGAYLMGIGNENYTEAKKKKLVFSASSDISDIKDSAFIVSFSCFPGAMTGNADVVLPTALWVEYDGTYVNAAHKVYRINKIIDPPQDLKSLGKIVEELSGKMGLENGSMTPGKLWNDVIMRTAGLPEDFLFEKLDDNPELPSESMKKAELAGKKRIKGEGYKTHKIYCDFCDGVSEIAEKRIITGV